MIERTSEFWSPNRDESTTTMNCLVIENENLRRKIQTLPVIEQAKGILMGHYGIPAEAAFEMLRRWSQDTNTKLHMVAETIISERCQGQAFGSSLSRRDPASIAVTDLPGRELGGSITRSSLSTHPDAAPDTEELFAAVFPYPERNGYDCHR